jgi:hypothetical protein
MVVLLSAAESAARISLNKYGGIALDRRVGLVATEL